MRTKKNEIVYINIVYACEPEINEIMCDNFFLKTEYRYY